MHLLRAVFTQFPKKKTCFWSAMEEGKCIQMYITVTGKQYTVKLVYSGPSLSGHSQERPPTLMWPEIFGPTTINAFTFPSRQRPPL